ncbi:MAG TPA: glycosyltransferase family 2 protein [Pseudomonadota bacterium]|nr:glycosyltransferase family 2 protein [Pseudomonadota bacterium]
MMPQTLLTVAQFGLSLLLLCLWLLLLAASVHLLRLGLWALNKPLSVGVREAPSCPEQDLPLVTVQLPMRNERFLAARAIRAACALDWPRDRLQIQVLDDSDEGDETTRVVDAEIMRLANVGFHISVVRRPDRTNFKAGHLDFALPLAVGEFVAVFDVDFVPPQDFLRRTVPHLLARKKLAFVQARWSFLNETDSLLTRVQALILHGLFLVEQAYLSAHNQPVQFNGSGGVFRKAALVEANGWVGGDGRQAASVTEDLDLSYRVRLVGYDLLTMPTLAVPTELPGSMAAFRNQQKRWVLGNAQVLRSLLGRILLPGRSLAERGAMSLHLLRHVRQPYLALSLLFLPLAPLGLLHGLMAPPGGLFAAVLVLWVSLSTYYGAALRRLGRSAIEAVVLSPVVMALSMGLCVALSVELLRGVFQNRNTAVFVRTPKTGGQETKSESYRPVLSKLARIEVLAGVAYVGMSLWLFVRGEYLTALGFGALIGAGLLWVGGGSLRISK